ncbi:substrate-binding domain-containing protein [Variovorax sp. M-6]|uniref:substrate-binding domain-containing protein n=1 Tax=Variovorax sp. M-6 TaxID=3233041 RepID=UPI003F946B1E
MNEALIQTYRRGARAAALGAAFAALSLSGLADAQESVTMGKGVDMSTLCGTKPTVVGLTDGYGGDTWRKIAEAEFRDEASKCKNITKIIYANANGDQQKGNSDINSMVAQGVNVLIAFTDFGDAMLPAVRKAQKAGVTVVPYFSKIAGMPGKDYAANVYQDQVRVGQIWADWMGANLKTGNVVFLGGTAGATSSQRFMDGFSGQLKKYPGLKLVDTNYIVTNWNPADGQKAVAGLIAKHGKIDGIASDYGVTTLAAIKAFEQAGLPIPVQATLASNNDINCKYLQAKKAGKSWPYFSLDGTTSTVRYALRRGMAEYQGTSNPESAGVVPYLYIDSAKGLDPKCDPTAPPDADLSSGLPTDKLNALFKK